MQREALIVANTFKEMKKAIGVLDVEKRFCRAGPNHCKAYRPR